MNLNDLEVKYETMLSEEEMAMLVGGKVVNNYNKCSKCDKCDNCS